MILIYFHEKKWILLKKSFFRLIIGITFFHVKNIFYIGKTTSNQIWTSKKCFLKIDEPWAEYTPPTKIAAERSKKYQHFPYGCFEKNTKNSVINRETSFTKISSKNYPYGDFDENFKKLAWRLRVKEFLIIRIEIPILPLRRFWTILHPLNCHVK